MKKQKATSPKRRELLSKLDCLRDRVPASGEEEEWIDEDMDRIMQLLDSTEDHDEDSDEDLDRILNTEDKDEDEEQKSTIESGRFKAYNELFVRNDVEPYAHFPVILLGIRRLKAPKRGRPKKGESEGAKTELIDHLIWFTVCSVGELLWRQAEQGKRLPPPKHPPTGYNQRNSLHFAVASAMERLEVRGGSIATIGRTRRACFEFLGAFPSHPKCFVRLPMQNLLRLRSDPRMTELDFRVLCAVHCRIGNKPYATTTMDDLGRVALGAATEEIVPQLKVKPLSRDQVTGSLGRLQEYGFIRRVLKGRVTFVCRSSTMSLSKLKTAAKTHFSKKKNKRKAVWLGGEKRRV